MSDVCEFVKNGNIWREFNNPSTYTLITTNSFLKKNGALVMGRGAAKQLRDFMPGIDAKFGQIIGRMGEQYGTFITAERVGAFQVKHFFKDDADLDLIKYSCHMLFKRARKTPDCTYNVNFPGIGNGRLKYEVVYSLLLSLQVPPNVFFWLLPAGLEPKTPSNTRMTVGKYKGIEIRDIITVHKDWKYLDWMIGQEWVEDKLKELILDHLKSCQEWNNYSPHATEHVFIPSEAN